MDVVYNFLLYANPKTCLQSNVRLWLRIQTNAQESILQT